MTNQQNLPVKTLDFEGHPFHVFEYDGKIAFLAQEAAVILGVKDVSSSLRESKPLEKGVDYNVVPPHSLPVKGKFPFTSVKHVSILYLSGFFLLVLRSNKPIAAPFTLWAIREAIPQAFQKKQLKELSEATLVKLVKEERQVLKTHGWIDPTTDKQLTFGDSKPDGPTGKEKLMGTDREEGRHD